MTRSTFRVMSCVVAFALSICYPFVVGAQILDDEFMWESSDLRYEVYTFRANGAFKFERVLENGYTRGSGRYEIRGDSLYLHYEYEPPPRVSLSGARKPPYTAVLTARRSYETTRSLLTVEVRDSESDSLLNDVSVALLPDSSDVPFTLLRGLASPFVITTAQLSPTRLLFTKPGYFEEYVPTSMFADHNTKLTVRLLKDENERIRIPAHTKGYRFEFNAYANVLTLIDGESRTNYRVRR